MSDNGSETLVEDEDNPNFALFRDCLSATLLKPASAPPSSAPKQRRVRRRARSSAEDATSVSTSTLGPKVAVTAAAAPGSDQEEDAEELADFIEYLSSEIFESLPEGLKDLDHRSWREDEALQAEYALPLTVSSLASLNLPMRSEERRVGKECR